MNEFKHLRDWRRVAGETELEYWCEALNDLCLAYESDNPFAAPQRYVPSPYTMHGAGSRLDFGDAELLAVYAAGGEEALRECVNARGFCECVRELASPLALRALVHELGMLDVRATGRGMGADRDVLSDVYELRRHG